MNRTIYTKGVTLSTELGFDLRDKGIVTIDDVVNVIKEAATEDMLLMAGNVGIQSGKTCQSCDSIISKGKKCDDCRYGSHGLKWSELIAIANAQGLECPILGTPFEVDYVNKKIIDKDPERKTPQRVCVDHCHKTMIIRGLLSDMGNMVTGGFERRRYGKTSDYPPKTITDYIESKIAQKIVGEKTYRS